MRKPYSWTDTFPFQEWGRRRKETLLCVTNGFFTHFTPKPSIIVSTPRSKNNNYETTTVAGLLEMIPLRLGRPLRPLHIGCLNQAPCFVLFWQQLTSGGCCERWCEVSFSRVWHPAGSPVNPQQLLRPTLHTQLLLKACKKVLTRKLPLSHRNFSGQGPWRSKHQAACALMNSGADVF